MEYDILLRGGRVIDPAAGVDQIADVAIAGGRVEAVGPELAGHAATVIDVTGRYVIPGLVDLHVHIPEHMGGGAGHAMLARAGVTTALDLSGPAAGVLTAAARSGAGLHIAAVEAFRPDAQLPARPTRAEIRRAVDRVLAAGGIGVKLHVDKGWEPEPTGMIIDECNRAGVWIASHCGTTATASDIVGLRETLALAGDNRLHVAHVNSYCRGDVEDAGAEAYTAVELLRKSPQVFAESYLAEINGSNGTCVDGLPKNKRVRAWLEGAGYPGTEDGLRRAIRAGWAQVTRMEPDDVRLLSGDEGVAYWEAAETATPICLPVNPAISRLVLGSSRRADGSFDVPALATDGGAFPRNVTVSAGLSMVEWGLLSLAEFVTKASWTPARILGLPGKGRLADADLAVVDPLSRAVTTTISAGQVIWHQGAVLGRGTRFLSTERGAAAVRDACGGPHLLDLAASGFYTGDGLAA
ncbi:amidohydrolase family protein [Acrocarpospora macrocephala]|uniref:D-glutamate deacylase n=1 Tax=Acrocarpospora macrocephala TaxID=150177 RepID=A0A5M3WNX4_9ACTN|nr:amidohydrolase [Acrocarpospora macrocephala]GES09772.1 D-glutamate deacylase [Acrocarpospora macrocephala]